MLFPPRKIEAEKNGILHFLNESFSNSKWDLPKDALEVVINIRITLMDIYDAMYRFQDEKKLILDLDDISSMLCKTIECLPSGLKSSSPPPLPKKSSLQPPLPALPPAEELEVTPKSEAKENLEESERNRKDSTSRVIKEEEAMNRGSDYGADRVGERDEEEIKDSPGCKMEKVNVEVSGKQNDESPKEEASNSKGASLERSDTFKRHFFEKRAEVKVEESKNEEEMLEERRMVSFDNVIEQIKEYITENNLTIRDAFKIFDTNVDQKVDRLELKRSIKDICRSKIAYQQIEDAVDYIEQNMGMATGALAFSEFGAALKKALKKAKYRNYKPKPEEG